MRKALDPKIEGFLVYHVMTFEIAGRRQLSMTAPRDSA
jgi:hypothetical protein